MGDVTVLLQRVQQGDPQASGELMTRVYDELRRMAAARMAGERPGHTLQPTALVHEAWLRLGGEAQPEWRNRAHFFGAAAQAMRRILVEQARRRRAVRRGGGIEPVQFEEVAIAAEGSDEQTLAVNDALEKLSALDARKAELVRLRYFAGLSLAEAAQAMEISEATASRWWSFARAWLIQEIMPGRPP